MGGRNSKVVPVDDEFFTVPHKIKDSCEKNTEIVVDDPVVPHKIKNPCEKNKEIDVDDPIVHR